MMEVKRETETSKCSSYVLGMCSRFRTPRWYWYKYRHCSILLKSHSHQSRITHRI